MGQLIPFPGAQPPAEPAALVHLNQTELLGLVFIHRGYRLKRSVSRQVAIALLENRNMAVDADDLSPEWETRGLLADWIAKNWGAIESQLPCKGLHRGDCRIYPCPTARHVSCWMHAKDKIIK